MSAPDLPRSDRWWRTADECRPGPGPWHRCGRCGTRYRHLGRVVPRYTSPCPMCQQKRQARLEGTR